MKKTTALLVLAALLIVSAIASASAHAQAVGSVRGGARDRAPVLDAKDFNLQNFEGRVVLLAFWKAGEEQSDAMVPWLSHLQEDFGQDGLSVVAVNLNNQSAAAAGAVETMHPHVQVVLDPTSRLATRYHLGTIPSGLLFDRAGGSRGSFTGFVGGETDTLEVDIVELLKEKPE